MTIKKMYRKFLCLPADNLKCSALWVNNASHSFVFSLNRSNNTQTPNLIGLVASLSGAASATALSSSPNSSSRSTNLPNTASQVSECQNGTLLSPAASSAECTRKTRVAASLSNECETVYSVVLVVLLRALHSEKKSELKRKRQRNLWWAFCRNVSKKQVWNCAETDCNCCCSPSIRNEKFFSLWIQKKLRLVRV